MSELTEMYSPTCKLQTTFGFVKNITIVGSIQLQVESLAAFLGG